MSQQIQQPKQYFADAHRAVAYGGGIEWEELPSLAEQLAAQRERRAGAIAERDARASAWDDTQPGSLDETDTAPTPFRESLEGLATREVTAPEIFRHFFGELP